MGCCRSKPKDSYKTATTSPQTELNLISTDDFSKHPKLRNLRLIKSEMNLFPQNEEAPTARVTKPEKSEATKHLIHEALRRHIIFSSLTDENSHDMVSAMKLYRLTSGETVFEQGMPGCNFYVIAAGKVEVLVNRRRVNTLKLGDSFGELALLQNLPRSATVKTLEPCDLWVISRQTFNEALKTANSTLYEVNKAFINGVTLFECLSKVQKDALITSLVTQKYRNKDVIIKEGDTGELFFIVKEGTVEVIKAGNKVAQLGKGEYFGEQALLYHCTRTATCIAEGEVLCLSITRENLTKALGNSLQKIIYRNSLRIAFSKSRTLAQLTQDQQLRIIARMEVRTYSMNSVVIETGTKMGRKLWVIVKGALVKSRSTEVVAELYSAVGDNEIAVESKGVFKGNLIAKGDCDVAEITKGEIERVIGCDLSTAFTSNGMVDVMKKAEIFHGLSTENLQQLSTFMTLSTYQDGQVIFEQGSRDSNFYIVKEGTVDVVKDGVKVRTISMLDYFGERSILNDQLRTASIVARGQVICWVLSKQSFASVFSPKVIEYLKARINLQGESVTLEQLAPVQVIGRGRFGTITLVVHRQNSSAVYALKSTPMPLIVKHGLSESLQNEKNVLDLLNHMFILRSIKSLEDQYRIYFLTELVRGNDLPEVLRRIGLLGDDTARFFTASLILILEHLHERNIVYRDLRPENVIVDDSGYLKLVDFGAAKIVEGRTYTIIGTPHYMAPEVILGQGYDSLADLWSLGVMLYEFICGLLPFGDDLRNPYDIYEAVLAGQIQYPRYLQRPFPSQSLVHQLLSKQPGSRIGEGIESLKNNKWFAAFDWNRFTNKEISPPFVPKISDNSEKIRQALSKKQSVHDFLTLDETKPDSRPRIR